MAKRIFLSYIGFLVPLIISLPFISIATMGGHSLMYMLILIAPIGLLAGLVFDDIKKQYQCKALVFRNLLAFVFILIFITLTGLLSKVGVYRNNGYLLVPLLLPAVIALLSDLVLKDNKVH